MGRRPHVTTKSKSPIGQSLTAFNFQRLHISYMEPEKSLKNVRSDEWTWEFWGLKCAFTHVYIDFTLKVVTWTCVVEGNLNVASYLIFKWGQFKQKDIVYFLYHKYIFTSQCATSQTVDKSKLMHSNSGDRKDLQAKTKSKWGQQVMFVVMFPRWSAQ